MRWDDPSLAGFARQAGWQGGDVNLAVAIILAASGGDDVYDYQVPFAGASHYVGLFGIDVVASPEFDISLMRNPVYNAQAAYTLWLRAGRSFEWSDAFVTGRYRTKSAEAALSTQTTSPTQYGFGLAGEDVDASGLARKAWNGAASVNNLATVVRGL